MSVHPPPADLGKTVSGLPYNEWPDPEHEVTVAIPTIPPRRFSMLPKAIASVWKQTYPISGISVATDVHRHGAARTRMRALLGVTTEWVAFLDDDDELYPQHVDHLLRCAVDNDADYVYSYWDTRRTYNYFGDPAKVHGPDEYYGHYGKPFDPANPNDTTSTILVRTELALDVGFRPWNGTDEAANEDHWFTIGCVEAGAKIVHLPEQTWYWRHHPRADDHTKLANTSGRPDRW